MTPKATTTNKVTFGTWCPYCASTLDGTIHFCPCAPTGWQRVTTEPPNENDSQSETNS